MIVKLPSTGKEIDLTLEEIIELQRLIAPAQLAPVLVPQYPHPWQYPWWGYPTIICNAGSTNTPGER